MCVQRKQAWDNNRSVMPSDVPLIREPTPTHCTPTPTHVIFIHTATVFRIFQLINLCCPVFQKFWIIYVYSHSFPNSMNYLLMQLQFFVFPELTLHKYSVGGCIDVTRTTHTNLEVLQESHVDDSWKVDVDRNLSDSWTGFIQFTFERKNTQKDFCGPGAAHTNSSNDQTCLFCGLKKGPSCRKRLRKWKSISALFEKPKVDNERHFFIGPDDGESKDTI